MATQAFSYLLSPAFRESHFLATGERLPSHLTVELDPAQYGPDVRRGIVVLEAARPGYPSGFGYSSSDPLALTAEASISPGSYATAPALRAEAAVFDHLVTADQAAGMLAELGMHYPLVAATVVARSEWQREHDRTIRESREREQREREERKELQRRIDEKAAEVAAQRDAERSEWSVAHGSAFLRKALAAGYDCQRRYVEERAALELPGFTPDFQERAEWRSRSCPSETALDETLALRDRGHNADVVWLTAEIPADGWDSRLDEPREAIVVSGYLGRYLLIK